MRGDALADVNSQLPTSNSQRHSRRFRRRWELGVGSWALTLLLSACATRTVTLPTDPGTPLPDHEQVLTALTASCRGVRTMEAVLGLSGRAGKERLGGQVRAGFERPASMRLEGVGPFGRVGFILAARDTEAVLVLPQAEGFLRGARPEEMLGALVGVTLAPADLLAIVTGCVVPAPKSVSGRTHGNGWVSIALDGGATVFAVQTGAQWRLRAARRDGWTIEYPPSQGTFPASVRLLSTDPPVDLTATLGQVQANQDINAAAFRVEVPRGYSSITVDELREAGPLRAND